MLPGVEAPGPALSYHSLQLTRFDGRVRTGSCGALVELSALGGERKGSGRALEEADAERIF